MNLNCPVPVIDIFAGPGGLSEGFASLQLSPGRPAFDIALSIEKDRFAHATLELRAFFRHLRASGDATDYYRYLWGKDHQDGIDRDVLFSRHPASAEVARSHAWHQELAPGSRGEISARIRQVLRSRSAQSPWVLLGGPPCQAYSVAGRSRLRSVLGSRFEQDERHVLYQEYLAILEVHRPHVFVMENVKGILSSQLQSRRLFDRILTDLRDAAGPGSYTLFPFVRRAKDSGQQKLFVNNGYDLEPTGFLIECEKYGVPQTRHRVIILGIRSDLLAAAPDFSPPALKELTPPISVARVLEGLPRLRSGLTKVKDTPEEWRSVLQNIARASWLDRLNSDSGRLVSRKIREVVGCLRMPQADRGGRFIPWDRVFVKYASRWYLDSRVGGVCNHEARPHMPSDLQRYMFAACFAAVHGRTPKLGIWPTQLLPAHENVAKALKHGMFNDRFRVQVRRHPATTITCHLAKDGHYNIHGDPSQCRSLTVREAARVQTFPDNYFFEGPRTQQYVQVGNAVPPLLARQLARIVLKVLRTLKG